VPLASKADVASAVLDVVEALRAGNGVPGAAEAS
jgi:hypothetical protein